MFALLSSIYLFFVVLVLKSLFLHDKSYFELVHYSLYMKMYPNLRTSIYPHTHNVWTILSAEFFHEPITQKIGSKQCILTFFLDLEHSYLGPVHSQHCTITYFRRYIRIMLKVFCLSVQDAGARWCSGLLRYFPRKGDSLSSPLAQYFTLWHANRSHLGRPLTC